MSYTSTKSEFQVPDPSDENGVRIIDPNPYGQIVPHEELFIYVNLKARQKSKTLLVQKESETKVISQIKNDVNIGLPQQKIDGSELFKTKPVLTTDWTEIGGFKNGADITDFEGFGITNIDIKIQSQTAPMIVIDFVDVRGATLFEQGSCSPYGLFFTLPYPIFELTVKGYYGKAVNYYLHLIKFNTKFNSENGNMECRAEFVGYSFAFLSDTIVSYVAASMHLPKKYNADDILREKYVKTLSFYQENGLKGADSNIWCDNQSGLVPPGKCMRIWDLVRFIKNFEDKTKPIIAGSDENLELEGLKILETNYRNYIESLEKLAEELRKELGDSSTLETTSENTKIKGRKLKYTMSQAQAQNLTKENGIIWNYFNKKTGFLKNNIFTILTQEIDGKKANEIANIKCLLKNPNQFNSQTGFDDAQNIKPLYDDDTLNSKPWMVGVLKLITYPPVNNESSYGATPFLDLGYLLADAKDEYDKIVGSDPNNPGILTKKRDNLIKIINDLVEKKLGFKPTIRNIFTVLLCNTDAFMQILLNVAIEAEQHHLNAGLKPDGDSLISGKNKIYSWPTYYEQQYIRDNKSQGTKEKYPGEKYPEWPEVIFVEDFIKAFLEFQEEVEILNGDLQDKPGYDNFIPINPLESRYWEESTDGLTTPNKYLNSVAEDKIKVLTERMFLTLDHSHLQPIRVTNEQFYIPNVSFFIEDFVTNNWNPLLEPTYIEKLGEIESRNFINSTKDVKEIDGLIPSDFNDFLTKIKNTIKKGKVFKTVKKSELIKFTNTNQNIIKDENFYVYKTDDEGISIKESVWVKPNPFDGMEPSKLIKIIKENDPLRSLDDNQKITLEDNFKKESDSYKSKIVETTKGISFETKNFNTDNDNWPKNNFPLIFDEFTQIPSFESPQLYTTLAMSFGGANQSRALQINGWWTQGTTPITSTVGGSFTSNMCLLTYWEDYSNTPITGSDNSPQFMSFTYFTKDYYKNDYEFGDINENSTDAQKSVKINPAVFLYPQGLFNNTGNQNSVATATLVTSPLWLDNVKSFNTNITDDNDQYKNLAYLFLNTLKTTPLIKRFITNDGYLYNDKVDSEQKQASLIWSLRSFNTISGVAKMPKAWLLTLGSQLWRWGEFVNGDFNRNSNEGGWEKWVKPLKKESGPNGEIPKGRDPLVQPGINFGNNFNNLPEPLNFRNNPSVYLKKIYNLDWQGNKYNSIFTFNENGGKNNPNGYYINGDGNVVFFPYFNYFQTGTLSTVLKPITDKNELTRNYSWPIAYIAPHHVPYISPEIFADGTQGRGSAFTLVTNDWVGFQDYNTLMPVTFDGKPYNEKDGTDNYDGDNWLQATSDSLTIRNKSNDGNMGMVVQNIPDEIKNIFVKEFEEWALDGFKNDILPIIDPVNFSNGQKKMMDTYGYVGGDNITNTPVLHASIPETNILVATITDYVNTKYVLALKDNEELEKLMTEQWWILNSTPKLWYGLDKDDFYSEGFIAGEKQIETYLKAFHRKFNEIKIEIKKQNDKTKGDEKEIQTDLSILDGGDDLKLSLYRTFKSITDKWISASKNGKLFFNIVNSSNGEVCGKLKGKGEQYDILAAHFQYVNRVMGDIGDYAVLDITKLSELRDNLKISLYTYISDLLTDNEYLFFSLPSYINFTGKGLTNEDLKDMFKPSLLDISEISCGPLFVSMYVGGSSRQLKFGNNKQNCYIDNEVLDSLKDDGFSFSDIDQPDEIKSPTQYDSDGYTAFKILYGLENQNHFKSIQLDQAEFSETAESLLVIDKLAQQQGNADTSQGQNLNAAYLTRSYSCTIESMGNMMIQPMTYFDLQGVPMFSGAYLILEVSHNFKPNNASTTFKGVRQPRTTVPIVTDAALAMDLSFKGKVSKSGSLSNRVGDSGGGNYNNVYSGLGNNLSNKTTKDSTTKCGYSSCVVTRKGIICALNNIAASSSYPDNYNDWLDFIVKKNYTTTADLDKVKAGFERLSSGLKIKKDDFVKILNVESYGGNPKAGACATCNCAGIIQWCTFGGGPNVVKNFSKNGKDIVTNIDLKDTFDIVKQPLWRQLDYAYDYMERNFNAFGGKIVRDEKGDVLLSDLYLLVLNPGSITCTGSRGKSTQPLGCVIGGVDTDLVIGGTQAKILYDCSLSSNNVNTTQNTQNIGNDYSSNTNKVPCRSSASISLNATTTHLLLGDSGVKVIQSTVGFSNPSKTKVDIGPNCGGEGVKFLVQSLKQEDIYQNKTYPNVKVIYTQIGVNGGYSDSQTLIKEYNDLITKIFPNAKKVIFGGTLGWGGVKNKTKATNQDPYYKKYQDLGWIYEYPACGEPCATSGSAYNNGKDISHDRTSSYFKGIIDIIDKYR